MLKVFFSAPATDSKIQRAIYQKITNELVKLGCAITYDWINDTQDFDPKSTTRKSVKAIEISDVLVAENTLASTGVGGQIALAQAKKIPVVILTRKDSTENTGFFSFPDFGQGVTSYQYTLDTIHKILKHAIQFVDKLKFVKFNFISTPEINQKLEEEAKKTNLSKSEYLRNLLEEHFQKNTG